MSPTGCDEAVSSTEPATPATDVIRGVRNIAAYIDEPERRTVYLLEKGLLPAGKMGTRWIASKRRLREHYARLTSGQVA